jgi:hypothetical protein
VKPWPRGVFKLKTMIMKKFTSLFVFCLLSASLSSAVIAGTVTGFVFCDANTNQIIDANDVPIAGVQVVVRGIIGTFSNSTVTASDGSFSLQIPPFDPLALVRDPLSQTYIETLNPATLPSGSTIISPLPITNIISTPSYFIDYLADLINVGFNSGVGFTTNGDWLINNPDCQNQNIDCTLSGSGVIKGANGKKVEHTFHGRITHDDGQWMHVAHALNLQFKSTTIQTVQCDGTNAMTFTGTGTLKGLGGNKVNYGTVSFTAGVEDLGQPGKNGDRYYLRVYTSGGTTLLLVSGDPANPTNIVTLPISGGNLKIREP